jgi:hypothetical protein
MVVPRLIICSLNSFYHVHSRNGRFNQRFPNILRGKQYCDNLFAIENEIGSLPPEERLRKLKELAEPILKEFHDWVFCLNAAPKSLLGKAVQYTRKYRPYLLNYLQDVKLEISNNRAERSIKPFVMGWDVRTSCLPMYPRARKPVLSFIVWLKPRKKTA